MSDLYDFNVDEVAEWIRGRNAMRVAIQLPEGLKMGAQTIARELEERTGSDILVLADPCFGACDFPTDFGRHSDALVQFGHSRIPSMRAPDNVLFVEVQMDVDPLPLLPEVLDSLKGRVGLVTTVQHIDWVGKVKEWLESRGISVAVGRGDTRTAHPGQVLGCNVTAATSISDRVDQFLYIGSGDFHPLAVSLETSKPVVILDPMNREVRDVEELTERILRQRHGAIVLGSEASSFAVLISTKPGQMRIDLANSLRDTLRSMGKEAIEVAMDRFDPEKLLAFSVDAYVSTGCPRVAIDDYMRYKRPILTPVELEISLGLRDWDEYRLDSILDR